MASPNPATKMSKRATDASPLTLVISEEEDQPTYYTWDNTGAAAQKILPRVVELRDEARAETARDAAQQTPGAFWAKSDYYEIMGKAVRLWTMLSCVADEDFEFDEDSEFTNTDKALLKEVLGDVELSPATVGEWKKLKDKDVTGGVFRVVVVPGFY